MFTSFYTMPVADLDYKTIFNAFHYVAMFRHLYVICSLLSVALLLFKSCGLILMMTNFCGLPVIKFLMWAYLCRKSIRKLEWDWILYLCYENNLRHSFSLWETTCLEGWTRNFKFWIWSINKLQSYQWEGQETNFTDVLNSDL